MTKAEKRVKWLWGLGGIILLSLAFYGLYWLSAQPGELDAFARCLGERGAKFYGTFWCPFCQKQKTAFGKSQKLLPYVECSTSDGKGQLAVCKEKGITNYPTWEFADGAREVGVLNFERLREKTGCVLPK